MMMSSYPEPSDIKYFKKLWIFITEEIWRVLITVLKYLKR